jgi:hypothetical protein
MHRGSCTDLCLHRKGKSTQLLNGRNGVTAAATRHADSRNVSRYAGGTTQRSVSLTDASLRYLNKLRPEMDQMIRLLGFVTGGWAGDTFSLPRRGSRANCRTERCWGLF